MKIILFGAPGCGKGTQVAVLTEKFGLQKISLGDILREEVKNQSVLGKEVKKYMEQGLLVPDELVARVIEAHVSKKDFVLDGYPRNAAQAQTLEDIFKRKGIEYDALIYMETDEKTIINRLSQRRLCKNCGAIYHLTNMPSKKAGICDSCGGPLYQRPDDTADVIKKRWVVFSNESKKILDFYRQKGKLVTVDGSQDKNAVFEKIKETLGCKKH